MEVRKRVAVKRVKAFVQRFCERASFAVQTFRGVTYRAERGERGGFPAGVAPGGEKEVLATAFQTDFNRGVGAFFRDRKKGREAYPRPHPAGEHYVVRYGEVAGEVVVICLFVEVVIIPINESYVFREVLYEFRVERFAV